MKRLAKLSLVLLILVTGFALLRGTAPQVATGTWQSGSDMSEARTGGAAVTLDDGRVLVFGGTTASGGATNAVQVFDPSSGSWSDLGVVMLDARSGHSATALADGRILLAGGENSSGPLSSLEIYDPAASSFSSAGTLSGARKSHGAARLPDGRVLMIGGSDGTNALASSEIYDPADGSVSAGPALSAPRSSLSATSLLDGKILIAGGNDGANDLASTVIYNPADGSMSAGASLSVPRTGHSAVLLPNNNSVLISGGSSAGSDVSSAELYIPWTSSVSATGAMAAARSGAAGAGLKQDGIAIVAGGSGSQSSELYGFATVKSDKDDYIPGEYANISGTGWQPGETVTLTFHEDVEPPFHPDKVETAVADAFGNIAGVQYLLEAHDAGLRYYLTVVGGSSGIAAQNTFTDAKQFTAVITPTSATAGVATSYTLTVTNTSAGSPSGAIACVQVTIPSGATSVGSLSRTATDPGAVDRSSGWSAATILSGTTIDTHRSASGMGSGVFDIDPTTGTIVINFTATSTSGTKTWTTRAFGTTGCTGDEYAISGAPPSVSVAAAVAVTFDATPIADVAAGTTVLTVTIGAGSPTAVTKGELPKTFTVASGTSVTYSYSSPLAVSAGKQYRWSSTSGLSQTLQSNTFTATATGTVTATYLAQFKVTFDASANVKGDGTGTIVTVAASAKSAGDLPFTTAFLDSGSSLTYAYASPVAVSSSKQYRWSSTSGLSQTLQSNTFTVTADGTVTGTYVAQFKVTFDASANVRADGTGTIVTVAASAKAAGDLPFTTAFLDSGSSLTYAYASPVAVSSTKQYRWDSTSGLSQSLQSNTFSVTAGGTVTGTYVAQFKLTFDASANVKSDGTGTIVTVDGSPKTAGDLPFTTAFLDNGSMVTYAYSSPVASSVVGKRYALTTPAPSPTSPVTVSGASTITGTYKVQFQLTFAQSGIGGDSTGTVVTVEGSPKTAGDLPFSDWFDSASMVSYAYSSPVASSVVGKRYALTTPAPSPTSPVTVSGAATITGTYKVQFELTFAQSGIGGDSTGTVVTVEGSPKTAADLPFSDWFDSASMVSYAYSSPVASSVSGKRYALTTPAPSPASPVTVSGAATITGTYKVQFELTFAQSGMTGDSSGTVVTVEGSPKTEADLPFSDWFDSASMVSYAYSSPVASSVSGKRYALTTPAPSPTSPVTVSGAATITGTYKVQYELTFAQSGMTGDSSGTVVTVEGSPKTAADLPFSDWFDSASMVSYAYASPVAVSSTKQYRWDSTSGLSQTLQSNTFTITGAGTVTGTYVAQFLQTFTHTGLTADATGTVVTVDAAAKAFGDLAFSKFVDDGATVSYTYVDPVSSSVTGKRYRLDSVTGPATGYTVSAANTITGNYVVQWFLTISVNPVAVARTNVTPADGWFDDGTSINLTATSPVAGGPGVGYVFKNWSGDVPGSPNTSNPLMSVIMSQARIIVANYTSWQLVWDAGVAFTAHYGDSTGLKAVLTADGSPVSGKTISFSVGTDSGSGATNGSGIASDSAVLTQSPVPPYTATAECSVAQCGVLLTITHDYDITPRPITVTADAKTKIYLASDPPLTYQITSGNLVFSDGFSGALTRVAGELPGTYAILQGTLTAGPNYDLTYIGANLTITYGPCSSGVGSVILPPINSDGTSVYPRKGGSTIPVKFRVCDAFGNSISNPAAVFGPSTGSITLLNTVRGTVTIVNEAGTNEIPDVAFRFSGDQWIFNMATTNLTAGTTYTFRINLTYGPGIVFKVGVK